MKPIKRIVSLALACILVVSMSIPAVAESPLEKSETVYTVLEPDGTVKSQSVSVCLHKEDGLSGVSDASSLSDIQCISGEGSFTQQGEMLTWNVAGTDACYTGNTEKQAPITAEITYSLNGQFAPISELLGKSGKLGIHIALTNHDTSTVKINGKDRQVCTPFITLVAAVLDENCRNIEAKHGKIERVNDRQVAGFLCLPGVKDSFHDLLPEKLDSLEDRLLDQVTIEADVEELSAPTVMILCSTDSEMLEEAAIEELDNLENLDKDIDKLDDAMAKLLDGAAQLTHGANQLHGGLGKFSEGVAELDNGAVSLQDGTNALQAGADALNQGSVSARDGASQLKSGADQLAAGLYNLQNGANVLTGAYEQLKSGSSTLSIGLNTLAEKSAELTAGTKQTVEGAANLVSVLGPQGQITIGSQGFSEALNGAASQASVSFQQLPSPESYAQLLQAAGLTPEQQAELTAAYTGAYQAAGGMSAGLEQLNSQYVSIHTGIQQAGQGAAALQQGLTALDQGLSAYVQGVADSAAGACQLDNGLNQLGQQLPAFSGGVNDLLAGAGQLSAGAGNLQDGNAALADGAAQLAAGIGELSSGTEQLSIGIHALLAGASELTEGAVRLNSGAEALENGLQTFNDDGISKLTEGLDTSKLNGLKETIDEMKKSIKEYGSFSGALSDSRVSTKFIMKTTPPVIPSEENHSEQESQTEEDTNLWDRILGLFRK